MRRCIWIEEPLANRVWILGAPDPEMELIEEILRICGESIIYATDESGQRVHSGNAYRCPVPEVPENSTVYAVECIDRLPEGWIRIDHHRPGDPGYGGPPTQFYSSSSIGQVIIELGYRGVADRIPQAHRIMAIYVAAADHCLAGAYRGECPGVDPDHILKYRVATRAKFQGRPVEELLADVERAREALREAPRIDLGAGLAVCDMRADFVPELPEAAMREGLAYLATVTDRDGRTKVVLGGHATPETVQAFMTDWAPAHGLVNIYGDPARGFAGGYLPHVKEATP